jgi:Na+/H+ antiporter NhaD/arsenite permease-like protein
MMLPVLFKEPRQALANMRRLDWDTTFFLMGIFVIVESLAATGWIETIAHSMSGVVGGSVLGGYIAMVVFATVVSGFVDNVPFLAAMLPVAGILARDMNVDPSLFLFGLLLGASLGGNITPIGASANIVGAGMLKKEGYTVTFLDFAKISVPFTLAAVIPAAAFVWFIWGP